MRTRIRLATLLTVLSPVVAGVASAQHGAQHGGRLGTVTFPNSCSPAVQEELLRGVAMLHSFYYGAARKAFEDVAAADSGCTIAAWGYAAILMQNPLQGVGASPASARLAQAAIERARRTGAGTERERDYLDAVAAYYEGFADRSERDRQLARSRAYASLAAKYPDDDEAQIFHALYLAATQVPSDQTYAAYLEAASILERQFARHPDHPGVAHYLIHSYDAPPIAARGMSAARRYAGIAPDAPHALHMPSHIFTRVGAWTESAATNRRSADVALGGSEADEALHAMDYMTYAYLQLGRDGDARRTVDEGRAQAGFDTTRAVGLYARAAMPARHAIERGAWAEAARLEPVPSRFGYTEAMTRFARALGAARGGDAAAARADVDRLLELRDALRASGSEYWANEVEVMRLASLAWSELARRRGDEALALMRQAADIEDRSEKNIVTPGRLLPARELLGDMLLQLDRPAEALEEYEASQRREPNRYRGMYGAGEAAARAGDREKARHYFSRLVEQAGSGDARPETERARRYLAGA